MTALSKSAWEVKAQLKAALLAQWATVVAAREAEWIALGQYTAVELQQAITTADVRIGRIGQWSGDLAIGIVDTGARFEPAYLGGGGMRQWPITVVYFFSSTYDDEKTSRMCDHYAEVIWQCLVNGYTDDTGIISCISEDSRVTDPSGADVGQQQQGMVGGYLSILANCEHII